MLKFKKLFSVVLLLAIVLTGCAQAAAPAPAPAPAPVEQKVELPPSQKTAGDYSFENSGVNAENFMEFMDVEDALYIDTRNF